MTQEGPGLQIEAGAGKVLVRAKGEEGRDGDERPKPGQTPDELDNPLLHLVLRQWHAVLDESFPTGAGEEIEEHGCAGFPVGIIGCPPVPGPVLLGVDEGLAPEKEDLLGFTFGFLVRRGSLLPADVRGAREGYPPGSIMSSPARTAYGPIF